MVSRGVVGPDEDEMADLSKQCEMLLLQLRVFKTESCVLATKFLKTKDAIKRVIRKEFVDISNGKIPEQQLLPQVLSKARALLEDKAKEP